MNWLASVRGRVGVVPFGNMLVYATGGFAMGDVVTKYYPGGFLLDFATLSGIRPGWTVGGGVEHAFAPEWTARLEYRYTELDTIDLFEQASFYNAADRNKFSLHALRAGLSWRPGNGRPGPTATKGYFPPPPSRSSATDARWTGFYAGAHVGGVWNDTNGDLAGFPDPTFGTFVPAATAGVNANGVLGGAQAGYNYQLGSVVLGLEQDISYTGLKSSASLSSSVVGIPAGVSQDWKLDWLASTRLRAGYAPNASWLIYGTGGIAYGWINASTSVVFPAISYAGSLDETRVGWIAGAGVQYAMTDRWSVRAEYLHYDLGGTNVVGLPSVGNPPFNTQTEFTWKGDIVCVGVDYKLGVPSTAAPAVSAFPAKAPRLVAKAPRPLSDFDVTFGGRYWYSTGKSGKDLFGTPTRDVLLSRLTYKDLDTHSAETFFRADHRSGLFVKGFAGIGVMPRGKQNDEDFPPFAVPYSNTESTIRDSKIAYISADVGYDVVRTANYRLGVFAGYHYDHEKMNEYGCRQVASGAFCTVPGPQSTAAVNITDDNHWHSMRLGLNGTVRLTDRLTLTGDAAWLPYTRLDANDTHWFRLSSTGATNFTGPLPEDGVGHKGYQLEAILNYQVTDAFSVGVGGRYWRMETSGTMHFENVQVGGGAPQPLNYLLERYGGFVRGAFRF